MGRRGQRARFKPGVYVFPGGMLERADYRVKPLTLLPKRFHKGLAVAGNRAKANALAMAAVREALEEAGLLFGAPGTLGHAQHPTWQSFAEQGLAPDLGKLDYLGRAITPTFQKIRFHARFFSTHFDQLTGQLGGDGELEDLRWIRLDDLQNYNMMEVQKMILRTLADRLNGRPSPPQKLFFAWGRINIVDA